MSSPLRVCVDVRDVVNGAGGTAIFGLSLARALVNLVDGDEQYFFLVNPGDGPSLEQQLQKRVQIIEFIHTKPKLARRFTRRIPFARRIWRRLLASIRPYGDITGSPVSKSDGTLEREKIDVVHFTAQVGFLTDIPFIYHPHDLQHRHFPEFFTAAGFRLREENYLKLCEHASVVSVVSQWGKQDLLNCFNLPESKVRIVHFAPDPHNCSPTNPEMANAVGLKLRLPPKFIFYPARTWPHKNHLQLLRALRLLRDNRGLTIPLVCSGAPTEFLQKIEDEIRLLGMSEQVSFVGFVDFDQLGSLYRLCSAVVIPTLFEAGSFPLWEAFLSGRPAACSNVTSLPAQAGDAALIFDPNSIEEIADAVERLWTDSDLCATLIARATANVSRYRWETTARTFRAIYRGLGHRPLTTEDEALLSAPPLM